MKYFWSFYQMPINWEFHWEEHIPKPQYMLYYWWLYKLQRLLNQLEIELGKFLSFFDLLWLPGFDGTEGFVPLGSRIGDLSLPDDPCPPDLGGLGQKVENFDGPPLPAPFGTKVPPCPLAKGPGAVLLVGRGLVGSSSE